jgi:uncharacterized protein YecT (DUF1311 family)
MIGVVLRRFPAVKNFIDSDGVSIRRFLGVPFRKSFPVTRATKRRMYGEKRCASEQLEGDNGTTDVGSSASVHLTLGVMKRFLCLWAISFVASSSQAQPDEAIVRRLSDQTRMSIEEVRRDYDSCSGTTIQMGTCTAYRWMVQDVRLNQVYRNALSAASVGGYKKFLIESQRAWIAYRDTTCRFEGKVGAGGGSAEPLHVNSCLEELTKERSVRLEAAVRQ